MLGEVNIPFVSLVMPLNLICQSVNIRGWSISLVQLTFKKWMKITIILMILSIIVNSLAALCMDKKTIEWDYVLLQSIGLPLLITGFLWLWGDITFSKKNNEEKTKQKEQPSNYDLPPVSFMTWAISGTPPALRRVSDR